MVTASSRIEVASPGGDVVRLADVVGLSDQVEFDAMEVVERLLVLRTQLFMPSTPSMGSVSPERQMPVVVSSASSSPSTIEVISRYQLAAHWFVV